jgi:hypothetical protein
MLLVGGLAFVYWSLQNNFDLLYNYQRIAILIPLFLASPFFESETLLNWNSATPKKRFSATCSFLLPVFTILAAISWYFISPFARA